MPIIRYLFANLLVFFLFLLLPAPNASAANLDNVAGAAGYNIDGTTSSIVPCDDSIWQVPGYMVTYTFSLAGLIDALIIVVDRQTSETIAISGNTGRSIFPTSDTIVLSASWAREMLNRLNVYKVIRGEVTLSDPSITYSVEDAKYIVSFRRIDGEGHLFAMGGVGFTFDHGTSNITSLNTDLLLPEPAVTSGTVISLQNAITAAEAALNARKQIYFQFVPDKMTFERDSQSNAIMIVQKDTMFHPSLTDVDNEEATSGTAVAYVIRLFKSRLTDPNYTGVYEYVEVVVYIDVFSGEAVGGDYAKDLIIPAD